jgi:hypothetical protein
LAGSTQDDAKQGLVSTLLDPEQVVKAGCLERTVILGRFEGVALFLETILGGGGFDPV